MAETLDQLVERARAAMAGGDVIAPAASDAPAEQPEPDGYTGADADGAVTATVAGDGHVVALHIEPALLRRPVADVAAAVRTAINAALAARPGRPDLAPVIDVLARVREQSRQEIAVLTSGFQDVETGVRNVRAAQRSGGAP